MNQDIDKTSGLRQFVQAESFGGMLLIFFSLAALILANSPLDKWYGALINAEFYVGINAWQLKKPLLLWVNDGLMALFFLYVGLEIKRETVEGSLSNMSQVLLPGCAALGGILFPAMIYAVFNRHDEIAMKGWAIPTATDIAFALGILSLLGTRVPNSLKLFLMAIAIFDDLAAIVIIAIFYTAQLSHLSLLLSLMAILALIFCNFLKIRSLSVYGFIGLLLWFFVLKSGVHATLAGVVLAFTIPLKAAPHEHSLSKDLEKSLHHWVSFFVLPLFAFANAGIDFGEILPQDFWSPLTLGIAVGLFLGKQLGIFISTFLLIKLKIASLPEKACWRQIYGVGVLCGIGFTMSLFISTLAFESQGHYIINSRLGIFIGTFASALLGYVLLRVGSPKKEI